MNIDFLMISLPNTKVERFMKLLMFLPTFCFLSHSYPRNLMAYSLYLILMAYTYPYGLYYIITKL